MIQKFGGNQVRTFNKHITTDILFCNDRYLYKYIILKKNQKFKVEAQTSCTLFLIQGSLKSELCKLTEPEQNVQIENTETTFESLIDETHFLFVSVVNDLASEPHYELKFIDQNKRVEKPWGYEVWITGEHPHYCLKKIMIKKGFKTSLQYHQFKRETNVLFKGEVNLHYLAHQNQKFQDISAQDLGLAKLVELSVIDVHPHTIHRLEALTDIMLYEVSTPELDDVIRLADDARRPSGRISSEHG